MLITGITPFMLNPGPRYLEEPNFWTEFFTPQFWPQVLARTGSAFLLASLYVDLHASFRITGTSLKHLIQKRSSRPALIGAVLLSLGVIGWLQALPPCARLLLQGAPVLNVLLVVVFAITVIIFSMLYVGPHKHPGWLTPGFSILFFLLGLYAVNGGEFIRESVRKPDIIYHVVLGNQIYEDEVPRFRDGGILNRAPWLNAYIKMKYPQLMVGESVDSSLLFQLSQGEQLDVGRA